MNFNKHANTIKGFGDEWERFDQSALKYSEHTELFERYFSLFPWDALPNDATGFDMGCGSGRWAKLVAPRVNHLHCIDPSSALDVARRNLESENNCSFHFASVGDINLPNSSMDFGYSLGVLHHVPDTQKGISDCVKLLKPGAPFLIYLYYSFDNRPLWFRLLWRVSELVRYFVSRSPHRLRYWISQIIAFTCYYPLARFALLAEYLGVLSDSVDKLPLSTYRNLSLYTMRTDALDRFGTQLEQRFSRHEIKNMMKKAGLIGIEFSNSMPYWCAVGYRKEE